MSVLCNESLGDNCIFELLGTPTIDSNILNIHSNNEGRLIYSTYDVYDIDVMRIIRALHDMHLMSLHHKKSTEDVCKYLNEKCIYLHININDLR